jgi:hypothetical protein
VRWIGTLPGGASTNNPLALTMNQAHAVAAVFRERDTIFANHWDDDGYYFPGDNVIQCRFYIERPDELLSLVWIPILPAGWTLRSAAGDGDPQLVGGEIVFSQQNLKNPITFTYTVGVPPGDAGARNIGGIVSYMLDGMANPAETPASPNPLVLTLYPHTYHTADYQDARWVIDGVEVSRVLAYWRAGGYRPNPAGFDGYAVGSKATFDGGTNIRHRADYMHPFWKINAPEANRVLAYWRAGGYRLDPLGEDGFAPLVRAPLSLRATRSASAAPLAVQPMDAGPHTYDPGTTLRVTNVVTFGSNLLGLCVRPVLPSGWTPLSVTAAGNPELVAGEVLWTGTLPASPVTVVLTVRVPVTSVGDKSVTGTVDAFVGVNTNPTNVVIPAVVYEMLPTDADGDGLPDAWEKFYSNGTTDMDPNGHNDTDGACNLDEWLAGTNPTDASSVLSIRAAAFSLEGDLGISWSSATDRVYRVGVAAGPAGAYVAAVSNIVATPPTNSIPAVPVPSGAGFLRILLNTPVP